MNPADYELWVDDHTIDDDGDIVTLAKYARPGIDAEVGSVVLVGDGEQVPFPARVIARTGDGVVTVRAVEDPASAVRA